MKMIEQGWMRWTLACIGSLTIFLSVVVVSGGVLLYKYQKNLIYPSSFPGDARNVVDLPSKWHMEDYEEMYLKSRDGTLLHCYLIWHRPPHLKSANRTILFLHANAGNMVCLAFYSWIALKVR